MSRRQLLVLQCFFFVIALNPIHVLGQALPSAPQIILETFPDAISASIELHEKQIADAAGGVRSVPFHLIVPTLNRWNPGSAVRVAFNGGDETLYAKIEAAADEWTKPSVANLHLQFKSSTGQYNKWSPNDTQYQADIRIAFASGKNNGGYWSHVGKDSIDSTLTGGSPGEASLNLDSFDKSLPNDWRGIVMHEFGHALGFQHEHQNPAAGCDFRFEDDPGYILTKDQSGWYTTDSMGRRPGLYTYLGGKSNYWPRKKVDDNLRAIPVSSAFLVGPFDKASIMKYFFGAFMFVKAENSPCFTQTENIVLSDQDKAGARLAYSADTAINSALLIQKKQLLNELLASPNISSALSSSVKANLQVLQ
jgi:hypothetical protein